MKRVFYLLAYLWLVPVTLLGQSNINQKDQIPTTEGVMEAMLKKHKTTLHFQENKGQWQDNKVQFRGQNHQATFQFMQHGVSIGVWEKDTILLKQKKDSKNREKATAKRDSIKQQKNGFVWNLNFVGANEQPTLKGKYPYTESINYITNTRGKVFKNSKKYEEIWYESIYPSIDARFYGDNRQRLEYDFIVHPNGKVEDILLEMEGVKDLKINRKGEIAFITPFGRLTKGKPYSYQMIDGKEVAIASKYVLEGDLQFRFEVEEYDPNYPLIIDPIVLEYGTYFSAEGPDYFIGILDVTCDSEGNIIVTGETTADDFPTTPGTVQSTIGINGFVTKFDPTLSNIIWSTYFIGDDFDISYLFPHIVEVDGADNIYVGGNFYANNYMVTNNLGIPTTPGVYQEQLLVADQVGFIGKLDTDGTVLDFLTYFGGPTDAVNMMDFELDASGNIIIVGNTEDTQFPTTSGAFQSTHQGGSMDWFVASLNSTASSLNFSTLLGGSDYDGEFSGAVTVEIGPSGNIYVAGDTYSTDFPTTTGVMGESSNSNQAKATLAVFNPTGNLLFSTYIIDTIAGVNQSTYVHDLAVDSEGNAYITGENYNTNFPYTTGAYSEADNTQGFLAKVDMTGQLVYATALVKDPNEFRFGLTVEVDEEGNAYVLSSANFGSSPIETTSGALNETSEHGGTHALQKYAPDGSKILYATYIETDLGYRTYDFDLMEIKDCKLVVAGTTESAFNNTTEGAYQTEIKPSNQDQSYIMVFDLAAKSDSTNTLVPASQTVCSNGRTQAIMGTDLTFQAKDYFQNGETFQQIVETPCQWQASNDGLTWEDIPGAVTKDFLPSPTTADVYFRRICGTCACDRDTSNVHSVIVGPDAAPEVEEGVVNACPDVPLQIGTIATGGTGGPYTYSWLPAINLNDSTLAQPTVTTNTDAIYNIIVTDTGNGCEFEEQWQISVVNADAGPDVTYCGGDEPAQLGTTGNPSFTYAWSVISGDPISSLNNPNIPQPLASPSVTTTYELSMTIPEAGCMIKDTVVVSVFIVDADAGKDTTLCIGEDVVLGEAATSGYTYGWSPGVYISSQTTAQPTFQSIMCPSEDIYPETNNPLQYTVTKIHNATGCKDIDTIDIHLLKTEMDDRCGATVRIGEQEDSCGLDLPGVNFTWSVLVGDAASIVGQESSRYPIVSPTSTTTYNLDVELNGKTCASQMVVTPTCFCSVDITADSDISCPVGGQYNTELIGAVSMPGMVNGELPTGYHYEWTPTFGLVSPSSLTTAVSTIPNDTTYYLKIVDESNGSTVCIDSIDVYASLAADPFEGLKVPDYVCAGTPTTIGVPGVAGWAYTWSPATGLSDAYVPNPIADISSSITYNVTAYDVVTGCLIDSPIEVVVTGPIINAATDGQFCENAIVELGSPAVPGQTYSWEPTIGLANPTTPQPIDTIFISAQYILTVTDTLTGCIATDTVNYTLTTPPTIDAGADISICAGANGVLIGPTLEVGYTYQWSPTIGLSDPTAAQPIANPAVTTTYTLLVSDGNVGCYASDEITVTVGPANSLSIDDVVTCATDSITIGIADEGGTYSWTPITGLGNPTAAITKALPASTTTYTLTWTTPDGCQVSDEATVSILPLPDVSAANSSICEGESVLIGPSSETDVTYVWTVISGDPISTLSATNIAQPMATPTQTTVYRVTASRPTGCSVFSDIIVTPESLPVVDLGIDYTLCGLDTLKAVIAGVPTPGIDHLASFEDAGLSAWTQDASDDFDWTRHMGSTPTSSTGPNGASEGMYYMYTEAVFSVYNDTARLISPSITLAAATTSMSFDWMMYGYQSGALNVDISNDGGTTWVNLWTNSGGGTQTWTTQFVDISAYSGTTVQFRVEGIVGSGTRSDMAIDNFNVPGATHSYVWNTGATSACLPIEPIATTIYSVTVTSPEGCEDVDSITVNPPFEVETGFDRAICPGESVVIGMPDLGAGYSYSWTPATGLSNSTVSNPSASPTTNTTYVLTVDNGSGCVLKDSLTISLKTPPTLDFIAPQTVCGGTCATIEIMPETGVTYYWSPSTGLNTTVGSTVIACPTDTTNYTVTAVSSDNCVTTTTATINVITDPPPTADAGMDKNICSGETVQLGTAETAGVTYYWTSPDAAGITALSNAYISNPTLTLTHTSSIPIVRTFIVEALDNTSLCSDKDTVLITVNRYPVVTPKTIPELCAGGGTLAMSSSYITYSGNNRKYEWTPAANVSDSNVAYPTLTVNESTVFTVVVTDTITGCATTASLTLNVSNEAVSVDAGPDQTVCVNDSVMVGTVASASPLGGDHSVNWDVSSIGGWTQANDDDFNWIRKYRYATSTASTGPSGPVSNLYYMYTEATGRTIGDSTRIVSPVINLSAGTSDMSFYYHMYGAQMGTMKLDVSTDGGTNWTTLWSLSGDQGNIWHQQIVDISAYSGMTVQFSFVGVIGGTSTSDMAIDDVSIPGTGPTYEWTSSNTSGSNYSTSTFYYVNGTTRFDPQPYVRTSSTSYSRYYKLEVTSENGCVASDEVYVQVLNEASTINAGPNQYICGGTTATLNATNPIRGTTAWTQESGPNVVTIADSTQESTQITDLVPGVYTFKWEVTDVCNPGSDYVTIEVIAAPSLVTNTISACGGGDLTATTVTTGSSNLGTLSYWADTTVTIQLPRPDSITLAGTYYIRTLTVEGCEAITPVEVTSCPACDTISPLISTRIICSGETIDSLGVLTTFDSPDSIAFVYFTSPQTDSISIYTNGIGIDTISIMGNETVLITDISGFTNSDLIPDTFYVYGIIHPLPTENACRPYEEIKVIVNACDWADLPDTSINTNSLDYQTTLANDGPRHAIIDGLSLGSAIDAEADGQPSGNALGDGIDEDGITLFSSLDLYPTQTFRVPFSYVNTTGNTAHVEAWIDWNGDGEFDPMSELVLDWNDSGGPLPNRIDLTVPSNVVSGSIIGLRIRISNQDDMTPYGGQLNGEVEDYLLSIDCPQICLPIQATMKRGED